MLMLLKKLRICITTASRSCDVRGHTLVLLQSAMMVPCVDMKLA